MARIFVTTPEQRAAAKAIAEATGRKYSSVLRNYQRHSEKGTGKQKYKSFSEKSINALPENVREKYRETIKPPKAEKPPKREPARQARQKIGNAGAARRGDVSQLSVKGEFVVSKDKRNRTITLDIDEDEALELLAAINEGERLESAILNIVSDADFISAINRIDNAKFL